MSKVRNLPELLSISDADLIYAVESAVNPNGGRKATIATLRSAILSPAAVKAAYESNADTNAFTDAEKTKLATVEANAAFQDADEVPYDNSVSGLSASQVQDAIDQVNDKAQADFRPSIVSGRILHFTGGTARFDGVFYQLVANDILLSQNITNGEVYIDIDGIVKQTGSGVLAPPYTIVFAKFSTDLNNIISLTDERVRNAQNIIRGILSDVRDVRAGSAASEGSSGRVSDAMHKHNILTGVPVNTGDANAEGTAIELARADHVHNVEADSGIQNLSGVIVPVYGSTVDTIAQGNDLRFSVQNILRVKKNPGAGEYLTIENALNAITTNSESNPYLIDVGAGVFNENPLTMKPYVFVRGSADRVTVVNAIDPTSSLINGYEFSQIENLQIKGVTSPGVPAIYHSSQVGSTNGIFIVKDCRLGPNSMLAQCYADQANATLTFLNCLWGNQYQFNTGFLANNNVSFNNRTTIAFQNSTMSGSPAPLPTYVMKSDGVNTQLVLNAIQLRLPTPTVGTVGIQLENGGALRATAVNMNSFDKAIYMPNVGAATSIKATALNMENNTKDLIVEHIAATGNVDGMVEYLKTEIEPQSSVFHVHKDLNIITVAKRGGDFSSIKSAVDSITTASVTNQYIIKVGPGVYIEDTILGKPYVTIIGEDVSTVVIEVNATNKHVIEAADSFAVKNITLRGATDANKFAVNTVVPGADSVAITLENIRFGNNYGYVSLVNNGFNVGAVLLNGATITQDSAPTVCYYCQSTTTVPAFLIVDNFNVGFAANVPDVGRATGTGAVLSATNWGAQASLGGRFFRIGDGARLLARQVSQDFFTTALEVENVGAAPSLQVTGAIFNSITNDILVSHPGATGAFQGLADSTKVSVNSSSPVKLNYLDAIVPDVGEVTLGDIFQGDRHDRRLALSRLIRETSPVGAYDGGAITTTSGLGVSISAGAGFIQDPVDDYMKEVFWSVTPLTLPADSANYIYVTDTGVVSFAASQPNILQNIILGRVATFASTIHFIDKSSIRDKQLGTLIEQYQREAIGPIYSTGSAVTENGTRGLDVSGGIYYFGNTRFAPSGNTAFTWGYHYRDGVGGYLHGTQNTVDNAQYDNNSGTLVALTAGYYAKHSFYIIGDGADEKYHLVYSQAEYSDLTLAQQGNIPTPPPEFTDGVTLIASIIVHQGTANIVEIRDDRPVIGFKASGVSAASFHSGLLGLTTGDAGHTQFLMLDGSKPMTGALDMGGQQITNVGNVDGVDISAHASRHLPNGADPIATAAPLTAVGGNTTNGVGTANSLARSDHQHAIVTDVPVTQNPDQSNAAGTSNSLARADHVHNIPAAAPTTNLSPATSNAEGSGTSFARNDHTHAVATALVGDITAIQPDDSAAAGTANTFARGDHRHAIDAAAPVNTGVANSEGASTSFARADHVHNTILANQTVTATADDTTASGTDNDIAGMTITPAAGTYFVSFSGSVNSSANSATRMVISIYAGVTQVSGSERDIGISGGANVCAHTQAVVTVNGSEAIEARWRAVVGTQTCHDRSMTIIRLG